MRGLGFDFTNLVGTGGVWDVCGIGGVGVKWVGGLVQGLGGWGGVMFVCAVSLDYLWRWQVQVSVYTSPAFMWNNARYPVGPHVRLSQTSVNRQEGSTQFAQGIIRPL